MPTCSLSAAVLGRTPVNRPVSSRTGTVPRLFMLMLRPRPNGTAPALTGRLHQMSAIDSQAQVRLYSGQRILARSLARLQGLCCIACYNIEHVLLCMLISVRMRAMPPCHFKGVPL